MLDSFKQNILAKKWFIPLSVFLLAAILALLIETIGFQFRLIRMPKEDRGIHRIETSQLELDGFSVTADGHLVAIKNHAKLYYHFPKTYVNKLIYHYESTKDIAVNICVDTYDYYGNTKQAQQLDRGSSTLTRSVEYIGRLSNGLSIEAPEGTVLSDFQIDNTIRVNIPRFLCIYMALLLISFLWIYRSFFAKKIEYAFLFIAFCIGSMLLLCVPISMASWDEQIHFKWAYSQSFLTTTVWTQAADDVVNLRVPSIENGQIGSSEEQADLRAYLDQRHNYEEPVSIQSHTPILKYNELGHLPQSLMLRLGRWLGLSFSTCFYMGRLGNLLMYIGIGFIAIKKSKAIKRLLSFVLLVPTSLFLATSYSYDPTTMAFFILAFVMVNNELLEPDTPLSPWRMVVFIGASLWSCFPKAVYIPIILLALLLPKKKFVNQTHMLCFKTGIVLLFLLTISTFVLPAASSSMSGDIRGGDTSVTRQLAMIFQNPVGYAKILLSSIIGSFGLYTFFTTPMQWAYLGEVHDVNIRVLFVIICIFTILTDNKRTPQQKSYRFWQRTFLFLLVAGTICLIWTALYLSFTPVGSTTINGVSARYYLPLLVPLFYLFQSDKFSCRLSETTNMLITHYGILFILLYCMFMFVIIPMGM